MYQRQMSESNARCKELILAENEQQADSQLEEVLALQQQHLEEVQK